MQSMHAVKHLKGGGRRQIQSSDLAFFLLLTVKARLEQIS